MTTHKEPTHGLGKIMLAKHQRKECGWGCPFCKREEETAKSVERSQPMDDEEEQLRKRFNALFGTKEPVEEAAEEEQEQEGPTVYLFADQRVEAHVMGEYVAVCWRLKKVEKTIPAKGKASNNIIVTETHYERSGEPYINFIEIREHQGEHYIGEESPVSGGISPAEALIVANELALAHAYLAGMGKV